MSTLPTKLLISYEIERPDGFEEHMYDPRCINGDGRNLIIPAMRLGTISAFKVKDISGEEPVKQQWTTTP